jgi:hypothetical protein
MYWPIIVNIKVFVELSGVLITKTSPCSFNQLYNILLRVIQKLKRIPWKLSMDAEKY